MANMLFHKDAQQYYVAPVVDGQRSTIYLGQDEHNAQTTCRKVMTKIEKYKKSNKKKKETAGERFLKLIDFQEKNIRTNSPKMFYHGHAKQFCVSPSIKGKRHTFYFGHDKAVADQKYHTFMAQYKQDKTSVIKDKVQEMTFSNLVDAFLSSIQDTVSPSTFKGYKIYLKVFCDFYPNIKPHEINLEMINRFKQYLIKDRVQVIRRKQGVSRSTVNRYVAYVKRVLNWGFLSGKLQHKDRSLDLIKREPVKRPVPRFLTKEEIQKILNYEHHIPKYCKKGPWETTIPQLIKIIKFMLVTGRRIQEVVHLKKEDICLEQKHYIVTKDKTERTHPVPKVFHFNDTSFKIIKSLCETRKEDEYLFCDKHGRQLSIPALTQRFKRMLARLDIKNVAFKELRHTFASHMRMAGEPIENIRDYLGHASVKTTEIYAHLGENHLKKGMNNPKINELIECKAIPPSTAEASIVERTDGGAGSIRRYYNKVISQTGTKS